MPSCLLFIDPLTCVVESCFLIPLPNHIAASICVASFSTRHPALAHTLPRQYEGAQASPKKPQRAAGGGGGGGGKAHSSASSRPHSNGVPGHQQDSHRGRRGSVLGQSLDSEESGATGLKESGEGGRTRRRRRSCRLAMKERRDPEEVDDDEDDDDDGEEEEDEEKEDTVGGVNDEDRKKRKKRTREFLCVGTAEVVASDCEPKEGLIILLDVQRSPVSLRPDPVGLRWWIDVAPLHKGCGELRKLCLSFFPDFKKKSLAFR